MQSSDSLPGDQKAVLQLVLGRGRSYDQIARMLSIDPAAVRERALAALEALGPQTRVSQERRALITDYLLGQLPESRIAEARELLGRSAPERAWARVVSAELEPLASGPLPEIPTDISPFREAAGGPAARHEPSPTPAPADAESGWSAPEPEAAEEPDGGASGLGAAAASRIAAAVGAGAAAERVANADGDADTAADADADEAGGRGRRRGRGRRGRAGRQERKAAGGRAGPTGRADGEPARASGAGGPRSSRLGGMLVILLAVVIIAVVLIIVLGSGTSAKRPVAARPPAAASSATTPTAPSGAASSSASASTTTAGSSTGAKVLAQINLSPPSGSSSKAAGIAQVLNEGSTDGIAIVAQGVAPNTTKPPNAYAVWLYNSPADAHILGFVNPGVGSSGRLATATSGGLPANAAHYKQLIVTLETTAQPKKPGKIILQGPLSGL